MSENNKFKNYFNIYVLKDDILNFKKKLKMII